MTSWAENLRTIARLAGDSALENDPDFLAMMPDCVQFAEDRIQRDLDLLATRITDETGKLTQNSKVFILPESVGTYVVIEIIRVITPNPAGPGQSGIWGPPLLPVSKECVDWMWPSELAPSSPSIPTMWAPRDQATVVIGPPPDQNYIMSCYGTMRFGSLNAQTTGSTFISSQFPDLFTAAQMIFISAYQRNWSAQSDDPAMQSGWIGEYNRLLGSSSIEEQRKKLRSVGFTSRLPSPIATPPQT